MNKHKQQSTVTNNGPQRATYNRSLTEYNHKLFDPEYVKSLNCFQFQLLINMLYVFIIHIQVIIELIITLLHWISASIDVYGMPELT